MDIDERAKSRRGAGEEDEEEEGDQGDKKNSSGTRVKVKPTTRAVEPEIVIVPLRKAWNKGGETEEETEEKENPRHIHPKKLKK